MVVVVVFQLHNSPFILTDGPSQLCFFKTKPLFSFRSEGLLPGLELFGFEEKIKSFIRPSKLF